MSESRQEDLYITTAILLAKQKLKVDKNPLFDAQGAYICDISKEEVKQEEIQKNINLGDVSKYKDMITVSLDTPTLIDKYAYATESRGSINPVFREIYFHLRGVSDLCKEVIQQDEKKIEEAYKNSLIKLNTKFLTDYNNMLRENSNIQSLNTALDRYRETLREFAYEAFYQELSNQGISITEKQATIVQKKLQTTVASKNDILYVNDKEIMFASGNAYSSHDKDVGANPALMQVKYFHFDDQRYKVIPNDSRQHYTVPSIAYKNYLWKDKKSWGAYFSDFFFGRKKYSEDVKEKIEKISERVKADDGNIIYNLYTSLNSSPIKNLTRLNITALTDENSNKQSQSAKYILLGAHAYNKNKIIRNDNPSFFVQNIPVNGYGHPLSYSINPLVSEATLMTEMSLVMTLGDDALKKSCKESYAKFLKNFEVSNFFNNYFNQYPDNSRRFINGFKSQIKSKSPAKTDDFVTNSKECLKLLMAHDCHFRNDAILFQALSVFVEPHSVAGCKSSIDRTPMVENRISTLNRILSNPNTDDKDLKAVKEAIEQLAMMAIPDRLNLLKVEAAEKKLEKALNTATDKLDIQSGAEMVANARIGGPPKYQTKAAWTITWNPRTWSRLFNYFKSNYFNTNMADSPDMKNTSNKGAKALQLHQKEVGKSTKDMITKFCMQSGKKPQEISPEAEPLINDSDDSRLSNASIGELTSTNLESRRKDYDEKHQSKSLSQESDNKSIDSDASTIKWKSELNSDGQSTVGNSDNESHASAPNRT